MNVWNLVKETLAWPTASQQIARRNALVAATALTQTRIERFEIDAFLDASTARHAVRVNRAAARPA